MGRPRGRHGSVMVLAGGLPSTPCSWQSQGGSANANSTHPLALRQVECQQRATHNGAVTAPDPDLPGTVDWLLSPEGGEARSRAAEITDEVGGDPLRAGARMRHLDLSPAHAAAALEQAALHRLARERGMEPDPGMLLTRDGLEAATGPAAAGHRACTVRDAGARRVLDLTGGLGFDTRAQLTAGLSVTAVEQDPVIARYLARNCPEATVVTADSTDPAVLSALLGELSPTDVVLVDPARRDLTAARDAATARARPERDPERWSPPWSWVSAIPHPRIAVKAAPGFRPPEDWHAQWVSVDRTIVECAAYSWNATGHRRSAAVFLRGDLGSVVPADTTYVPTAVSIGAFLHEVDPAVSRAGALASLAADVGLAPLGDDSIWLTGDHEVSHAALRAFRVVAELAGAPRDRRRLLRQHGVTRASIKCRDVPVHPSQVLRDLGLLEGTGSVIAVMRLAGSTRMVLAEPIQSAS